MLHIYLLYTKPSESEDINIIRYSVFPAGSHLENPTEYGRHIVKHECSFILL